ncbi:MAG: 2-amino-4-hydroxy-6-hydroxymethyldihydropteridinepyrophosphokinase [Opitutia bacterium UBA7350]|nr:MAG: 2-amino-4-hydroxy-6-hydroxymethyldihydropteridinepyrophosphokinase [Opitutae bacterium UBA7350]
MPLTRAFVAFGSNVGDRLETMREALRLLTADGKTRRMKTSPVYQNRAVGMGDADPFLNAVVEFKTALDADALLEQCFLVEAKLGRQRATSWQPRTLDLDLLAYGTEQRRDAHLTLPHPRISERDFVAQPLCDLAPDLEINGQTMQAIVAALPEFELELFREQLEGQSPKQ